MNTTMLAMSTGSNHAYCAGNIIARLPNDITEDKTLACGMIANHPAERVLRARICTTPMSACGSFAPISAGPRHVCFTPVSDRKADMPGCPHGAQKQPSDIAASARLAQQGQ